jgi:hypothetical protein
MEPRHLIRAAIAVSVIGHLALAVGVYFADARPFDPSVTDNIAVDIVTPEQVAAVAKEPEPKEPDAAPFDKPKPEFRLPDLNKPTNDSTPQSSAQKPASRSPAAQKPPPPSTQQQAAATPAQPSSSPPPAAQQATEPPASQPQQQQAALQPPPSQLSQPAPATAEPDITVKYGVMLGLPDGNGGSTALSKADIAPLDIAAFRRHLKTCSKLPAAVTPNDKVRIVLRAFLAPNGRLSTEPSLIEASASAKGPLLMQAAMRALEACQPYAMLPADKYQEWKVLDLAFTPQDFAG